MTFSTFKHHRDVQGHTAAASNITQHQKPHPPKINHNGPQYVEVLNWISICSTATTPTYKLALFFTRLENMIQKGKDNRWTIKNALVCYKTLGDDKENICF